MRGAASCCVTPHSCLDCVSGGNPVKRQWHWVHAYPTGWYSAYASLILSLNLLEYWTHCHIVFLMQLQLQQRWLQFGRRKKCCRALTDCSPMPAAVQWEAVAGVVFCAGERLKPSESNM
jgi:hypothetical protein